MKLSKEKFDALRTNQGLFIALVGMSNVGKSYIAGRLAADLKFAHHCIDDLIEAELNPFLEGKGFKGIDGVAAWMGQPYAEQYHETQHMYLGFEEASMRGIEYLTGQNRVIDTTGSVVYLPEAVLGTLKEKTVVVYLEATAEIKAGLFQRYISNPKPVIWGTSFNRKPGESELEALKRCYPQLLQYRDAEYRKLADVAIPCSVLLNATGKQFLHELRSRL